VIVRNLLTPEECESLITTAEPRLIRSTVIGSENDAGRVTNDRTSMGAWLGPNVMGAAMLEQKVARLTSAPHPNSKYQYEKCAL
jgi:hypothetical protein